MDRRSFLQTISASLLAAPALSPAQEKPTAFLTEKLEATRKKHLVPALAAARFGVDGLTVQIITGVRKTGEPTPVTNRDIWHFGSMTKAMTAALLATYVEEGRLHWEDILGKLIPDSCQGSHPDARKITVRQLLQHRSGLPANLPSWWFLPGADQRGKILALAAPPDGRPPSSGTFLYSNVGYAIAGHVAEKLDGKPWEELIEKRLFRPLKITAGHGPTGENQPWPHDLHGTPLPFNGPAADNPPSLGPAGRVHASLTDYARFAADHLRGATGQRAFLKPESYQSLHRPDPGSHYACGWGIAERPWAGGRCLTHTGSNNSNFSVVWLAPEKAFGVIAVCNQAGASAAQACDAACSLLIREG